MRSLLLCSYYIFTSQFSHILEVETAGLHFKLFPGKRLSKKVNPILLLRSSNCYLNSQTRRLLSYSAAEHFDAPVSRFEFERIDLVFTLLPANQPVVSESECARDQCQCAAVTSPVNLSFPLLSRVSRHLIDFIAAHRQLTISISVSAITVLKLVYNLMPSRPQIVHWPQYKLSLFENSNRAARKQTHWQFDGRIFQRITKQ